MSKRTSNAKLMLATDDHVRRINLKVNVWMDSEGFVDEFRSLSDVKCGIIEWELNKTGFTMMKQRASYGVPS